VVVCIYDIAGNLVRTLNENDGFSMGGGFAAVVWDGNNDRGEKIARGVYIVVVTSSTGTVKIGKICSKEG
jgi:flagellar hook assembly protein FlgD